MTSAAAQEVWLARPGELIVSQVEELATRIGGQPLYPAGCPAVAPQLMACQTCGDQLALILQAYAPLTAEQTGSTAQPRRLLYVFGCTAEGCGKQPGCWQALRLTLPSSPATSEQQQPQQQQAAPQAQQQPAADDWGVGAAADWGAAADDDWGMGGGDDWGAGQDEPAGGDAAAPFDFGDLNAALEAVGSAAPAAKPASKQQQQAEAPSGSTAAAGAAPAYDPAQPSLPAFYLFAEPESQCSASGGRQQRSEQEHLQQLMARYEAEAAAAGEAMEAAAGTACAPAVEGGPESWAGEGYEEDAVLAPTGGTRAGVGAAFFRFAKQLGRCPDQCARYSFGGTPLWPAREQPAPAPCAACGRPRVFELQLMTPLMPALTEAAEWLAAEEDGAAAAAATLQPPDSWEWLTVAVFSCSASCGGAGGQAALIREEVIMVNEE